MFRFESAAPSFATCIVSDEPSRTDPDDDVVDVTSLPALDVVEIKFIVVDDVVVLDVVFVVLVVLRVYCANKSTRLKDHLVRDHSGEERTQKSEGNGLGPCPKSCASQSDRVSYSPRRAANVTLTSGTE